MTLRPAPKKQAAPGKKSRLPLLTGAVALLLALIGVGLWAAGVFRFQTEQGDLVLESAD